MLSITSIFEYQGKRQRRRMARYPGVSSYAYNQSTQNTYSEGGGGDKNKSTRAKYVPKDDD